MSTKPSRKRGGDESFEIFPKKIVPEVLESSHSVNYDVTIIVDEQKFHCLKEGLSHHSMYFERMFNSNFQEKDKKEVELKEIVESESFDMFLKVVNGEGIVTDVTVEKMLELASYLESETLEAHCVHHLGQKTGFSLAKQFEMAETYHSNKLMIQVCASIKDAYELDEVVPKDLDSFCNTTKNLVMQRSFELLGIRKPLSPPLPDEPDQVFENLVNQIIDQVEVQNHHGEVLRDQVKLLYDHIVSEVHLSNIDKTAKEIIGDDPLVNELLSELQNAHEQSERNFVHAQLQVLTFKHIYTRVRTEELQMSPFQQAQIIRDIPKKLLNLSRILNRDKRSQSRSHKATQGNRVIDELYRRITGITIEKNQAEQPRNTKDNAKWLQSIRKRNDKLAAYLNKTPHQIQRARPDNQQNVSNRASFRLIDDLLNNARNFYYMVQQGYEPEQNEEANMRREIEAQNPREQDQEGN